MIALREDCYLHLRKLRHKDTELSKVTQSQGSLAAKCMFTR